MIPSLASMIAGIRGHVFVSENYYARLDCDSLLNARDRHRAFDSDWSELYESTESRWREVAPQIKGQVDEIRKESFLIVSRATQQHEIACYVSDDFDLICRCMVLGIEHPLIEYLWQAYGQGEFPLASEYSNNG